MLLQRHTPAWKFVVWGWLFLALVSYSAECDLPTGLGPGPANMFQKVVLPLYREATAGHEYSWKKDIGAKAHACVDMYLNQYPQQANGHYLRADMLRRVANPKAKPGWKPSKKILRNYEAAYRQEPSNFQYSNAYAVMLSHAGQRGKAIDIYEGIVARGPSSLPNPGLLTIVKYNLGQLLLKEPSRAAEAYKFVSLDVCEQREVSGDLSCLRIATEALILAGRVEEAERQLRALVKEKRMRAAPSVMAWMAAWYREQEGNTTKAEELARLALKEMPRPKPGRGDGDTVRAEIMLELAKIGELTLDFENAKERFEQMIQDHPSYDDGPAFYVIFLTNHGKVTEAQKKARQNLARAPDHVLSLIALAEVLQQIPGQPSSEHYEEAEDLLRRALRLDPGNMSAKKSLSNALSKRLRQGEAAEVAEDLAESLVAQPVVGAAGKSSRQSLDLHAADACAAAGCLVKDKYDRYWSVVKGAAMTANDNVGTTGCQRPYASLAWPLLPRDLRNVASCYSRTVRSSLYKSSYKLPSLAMNSRLRVGYASPNVGFHPNSRLVQAVFQAHSRDKIETYLFILNENDGSRRWNAMKAWAEVSVDLSGVDGRQDQAQRINHHKVHCLVDLNGYLERGDIGLFMLRPAPVQINFLAYPGTVGDYKAIQYFVADRVVVPPEYVDGFTEKLVYMPHSYKLNSHALAHRDILVLPDLSIAETGLTDVKGPEFIIANFNNFFKIDPDVYMAWMEALKEVPNARLWLAEFFGTDAIGRFVSATKHAGVSTDRISFTDFADSFEHYVRRSAVADVFADTFVFNAHCTAVDLIWGGLPVLTKAGAAMQARVAASVNLDLGLPFLITHSKEEYVKMLASLALPSKDTGLAMRLRKIRQVTRNARVTSGHYDYMRWTRNLEAALEGIWDTRRPKAKHIVISPS